MSVPVGAWSDPARYSSVRSVRPAPVHAVTGGDPQAPGEETGGARLRTLLLAQAGGPLLRVTGQIGLRSAGILEDALRLPWAVRSLHTVRVDLGGVSSCDSQGLAVLLAADQRARERGVELLLLNVPPQMGRLFAASGADEILTVVDPEAL